MPNTVQQRIIYGGANTKRVVKSVHIIGVDAQESDLVIYDNSAFVGDVTKGKVMSVKVNGLISGSVRLEFDATSDTHIAAFGQGDDGICFKDIGGLGNPGGAGATGDILLTTVGLAADDEVHVVIEIDQS